MIGFSLGALGAAALLIIGLVFTVLTAVLAKLSGDEVSGWLPVWSNHFLESAVSVVAPEYQDRYREEWKAELAAFHDRKLSGLRFAWRLRRRARSVDAVLSENDGLGKVFEPESAPVASRPLEPDVIAEIVRRVVERSRPRNQLRFEEILNEMRELLGEIDQEVAGDLAREYVGDISEKRRAGRSRPTLPAMRPRKPMPPAPVASRRPLRIDLEAAERLISDGRDEEDYEDDWGFLSDDPEARFSARTRRPETWSEMLGRTIRSWLRGEIRL
jgi:hypothetical protein